MSAPVSWFREHEPAPPAGGLATADLMRAKAAAMQRPGNSAEECALGKALLAGVDAALARPHSRLVDADRWALGAGGEAFFVCRSEFYAQAGHAQNEALPFDKFSPSCLASLVHRCSACHDAAVARRREREAEQAAAAVAQRRFEAAEPGQAYYVTDDDGKVYRCATREALAQTLREQVTAPSRARIIYGREVKARRRVEWRVDDE